MINKELYLWRDYHDWYLFHIGIAADNGNYRVISTIGYNDMSILFPSVVINTINVNPISITMHGKINENN